MSFGRGRGITLLGGQRLASTLTVLSAFGAVAASGELGLPLLGLFAVAFVGALRYGRAVAHKFNVAWTVLLAAALILIGLQVFGGAVDIVLGSSWFALLLTIHRLWNRTTERDEMLLLLLSLLLLCAGAALSAELLFGLAFACFAVTGTWALSLTHLRFRIEAAKGPEAEALLTSRRLITPQLLGALGGLSLLGLLGATVVFFVFPRVTIGGFHRAARASSQVGLSDRVELRGSGTLEDDPRVVLRVRLDPAPNKAELDMHWRARVLETWTGQGWKARTDERSDQPARWLQTGRRRQHWVTADIEAVGGFTEGVVLTPEGTPISVRYLRPLTAKPAPQHTRWGAAGDVFYEPIEVGDLRYSVTVSVPNSMAIAAEDDHLPAQLPPNASVDAEPPEDLDPRIRELGRRLTQGKPLSVAVESVRSYLEQNFAYTRELAGDQTDPIAHFLFERKKGHCELFSSAMVLLLRSQGIPARNVTGFYGGIRTQQGYYAVRNGDAHSWVEVWMPGQGFVTFDPTPASDRGSQESGLWARTVLLWDGLQARWRSLIVDYDLLAQGRAVQGLGDLMRDATRRLSGKAGPGVPRLSGPVLWALAIVLAITALVVWRRLRWPRLVDAREPLTPDQERAQLLLKRTKARLAKAGVRVPEAITARELQAQVARDRPELSPQLADIVTLWSQSRWGGAPLHRNHVNALLRTLDRTLRETARG